MKNKSKSVRDTENWLTRFVIGLNICPFAKNPYQKGLIRINSSIEKNDLLMMDFFTDELALLELNLKEDLATTLLVYPNDKRNFSDFNQWSSQCDNYLIDHKLTDDFQIVVFHPQFYFLGSTADEITNKVNQSPYSTIHIIRQADINQASLSYPDIDLIPERNRQKLLKLKSKI
jgi:hypothetical protein